MKAISSKIETLHKSIYRQMKNLAQNYEVDASPELVSSRKAQKRISRRPFKKSSIHLLLKRIEISKVIYIGDFHTFDQNSRNLWRILRFLINEDSRISIGVEFVYAKHQHFIDHYLKGHITELEFLDSIHYQESWRFPWNYYREVFELAKKFKIDIIALNSEGTLEERDLFASSILSSEIHADPERQFLILFGEYHILPNKLPLKLRKSVPGEFKHTIIHQNLDEVYWKLRDEGQVSQVVSFNKEEFVLLTSPPWVKYESLIYWYENMLEDPDFDLHEPMIDDVSFSLNGQVYDNFVFICDEILKTIVPNFRSLDVENFNLRDHNHLELVEDTLHKINSPAISSTFLKLLGRGKSFKIPRSNVYYCSNYSINRLSWLAGVHIHSLLCEDQGKDFELSFFKKNSTERYIYFLFQSFFGYLSSKIINPYRKTNLYKDIKNLLNSGNLSNEEKLLSTLTLSVIDRPRDLNKHLYRVNFQTTYLSARQLGHMMADIFYDRYLASSKKKNFKSDLITLTDVTEKNFIAILYDLFPRKSYRSLRKRHF